MTGLSARTFGTWTILASIIRLYAAAHIHNPAYVTATICETRNTNTRIYQLAFSSYALAGFHFISEWLVFGTAKLGKGLAGPLVVSSVTMAWMLTQWNYYVPA